MREVYILKYINILSHFTVLCLWPFLWLTCIKLPRGVGLESLQ